MALFERLRQLGSKRNVTAGERELTDGGQTQQVSLAGYLLWYGIGCLPRSGRICRDFMFGAPLVPYLGASGQLGVNVRQGETNKRPARAALIAADRSEVIRDFTT